PEAVRHAGGVSRVDLLHPHLSAPAAGVGADTGRDRGMALPGPWPSTTVASQRLSGTGSEADRRDRHAPPSRTGRSAKAGRLPIAIAVPHGAPRRRPWS